MTDHRRRLPLYRPVPLLKLLAWPLCVFTFGLVAMGGYLLQLGGFIG